MSVNEWQICTVCVSDGHTGSSPAPSQMSTRLAAMPNETGIKLRETIPSLGLFLHDKQARQVQRTSA